jgi:hypothetical protein
MPAHFARFARTSRRLSRTVEAFVLVANLDLAIAGLFYDFGCVQLSTREFHGASGLR